jgi:hypothetical protein
LDDRLDSIKIQSDYWIGKTFALEQKGIAYLNAGAGDSGVLKSKEPGTASFMIQANQPWSVEVTEGSGWLSVEENASGGEAKKDTETEVRLRFKSNLGEARVGKLTIFDRNRNEKTKVEVQCTQEGIILVPVIPADQQKFGYFRIHDAGASQFTIAVESNGDWIASKENEGDNWYAIVGQTAFNGNGTITVEMTENTTPAVRIANIVFNTPEVEGAEVVTKSVTIKQANTPQAIRTKMDAGGLGAWNVINGYEKPIASDAGAIFAKAGVQRSDFKPGNFKVKVKDMTSDTWCAIVITYVNPNNPTTAHSITIGLNNTAAKNQLWTFVSPWGFAGPQVANFVGAINMSAEHTFGLNLSDSNGAMHITYHLDEVNRHDYICDGVARTSAISKVQCYDAFRMAYDSEFNVQLIGATGTTTFEWFEYTPNIDWKD